MDLCKELACEQRRALAPLRLTEYAQEAARLRACQAVDSGFVMISSLDSPSNATAIDVACDDERLYVTVMTVEAMDGGLINDGYQPDHESVELLIAPYDDALGYRQFGLSSGGEAYDGGHWPYAEPNTHVCRDGDWLGEVATEYERPDLRRFYHFAVPLESIRGGDCIGFNVGRSQTRIHEHSMWNPNSGIGFCDPGCLGRLWLSPPSLWLADGGLEIDDNQLKSFRCRVQSGRADAVTVRLCGPDGQVLATANGERVGDALRFNFSPAIQLEDSGRFRLLVDAADAVEPAEFWTDWSGATRELQFQGTYDWPDHFLNVAYSPDDLEAEMRWYHRHGLRRVYWLDYDYDVYFEPDGYPLTDVQRERFLDTWERFGGDFLQPAVAAAHAAGLEFITVYKPLETRPTMPVVARHPEWWQQRHPDWQEDLQLPICGLRIFQDSDRRMPFTGDDLTLWAVVDGRLQEKVTGWRWCQRSVWRAHGVLGPAGVVAGDAGAVVRCLEIEDLQLDSLCLAIELTGQWHGGVLQNRAYRLIEVQDQTGQWHSAHVVCRNAMPEPLAFDFGPRQDNVAAWAMVDTGRRAYVTHRGAPMVLGISLQALPSMPTFEPCHDEVQAHWLSRIERALAAGVDGVSMRAAHHVGCNDWGGYMYAPAARDAFVAEHGRAVTPSAEDSCRLRLLRGDAYSQFVCAASERARAMGKRITHHVENRMLAPSDGETYTEVNWDWRRWIREGWLDEIDLKYIGPDHPACWQEIVPLARQHGVKVNWITGSADPRCRPRWVYEAGSLVDRARAGGLDGINLYELWIFHRMTRNGTPMPRGAATPILKRMKERIDHA